MITLFDLKSRDDIRRFIHSVAPSLATLLISIGCVDKNVVALVLAVILAGFNDRLAHINSPDSFRQWFYPVLSASTAALVGLGIFTDEQITPWLAIVPILIGGGMGAKQAAAPTDETKT